MPASIQLETLLADLDFSAVDAQTALGEIHGVPAEITLLGTDPLALLCRFRVDPAGSNTQPLRDIFDGVPEEEASVSVETGAAWISLYDLSRLDNETLNMLLEQIAEAIQSTDLAVPPGCLRCGATEELKVLPVEATPTRICQNCFDVALREFEEAEAERRRAEEELNRPSVGATLGLPGAALFAVAAWAGFWTLLDVILEALRVRVIEINALTAPAYLAIIGAFGWTVGWPTGATLRRSLLVGKAPQTMAVLFVVLAAIAGEILYFALFLLRMAGKFDLAVAARFIGDFVATYDTFWVFCKLACIVATAALCAMSASTRTAAKLQV